MQRSAFFLASGLALVAALGLSGACSGNDDNPDDPERQRRIEIQNPPGDSIGLPLGGETTLNVRYLDADDLPIDGAAVGFELVAGPGEAVGASALAASAAATGTDGRAEVVLAGGSGPANFRVRVTAPRAPDAFFFVVISDSGFAEFLIDPDHRGARDESEYEVIEFRLYDQSEMQCDSLNIDDLPPSVLPARSVSDFETPAQFLNLATNRGYVIVTWGEPPGSDVRLGFGCIELSPDQVAESPRLNLVLALTDRDLLWPHPVSGTSVLLFPELVEQIDAVVGADPWTTLRCPLGPAQLVLDCALDAAAPDGLLDCAITGDTPLLTAVMATRGDVDGDGCRGALTTGGQPSVESILNAHLTRGPWTVENAAELAMAQTQLLSGFTLESELRRLGQTVSHRLVVLHANAVGLSTMMDLTSSNRPVLDANASAPLELGVVQIAAHGFTFDLERALGDAFVETHLAAAGLIDRASDLGIALTDSFEDGGQTACTSISNDVCVAAGLAPSCLATACTEAATALDERLLAWIGATEGSGLDIRFDGSATVGDTDFDLAVDQLGGGAAALDGNWNVVLETSAGSSEGRGAFGGSVAVP